MRRLSLYILTALLTLGMGIGFARLINSPFNATVRKGERDKIYEAVFRYQIQRYSDGRPTIYFISCGSGDDAPSEKVMEHFNADNVTVKAPTDARLETGANWPETSELDLHVGELKWISNTKVVVGGSYHRSWGNPHADIYYLKREGDQWVVKRSEPLT